MAAGVAVFVVPAGVVTLITAGGSSKSPPARGAVPVVLEETAAPQIGSMPTGTKVPRLPAEKKPAPDGDGGGLTDVVRPPAPTPTPGSRPVVTSTPAPTPTPAENFETDGGSG